MTFRSITRAAALATVLLSGAAVAQVTEEAADDIYLATSKTAEGKAVVLFLIANSTKDALTPKDAFTISLKDGSICEFDFAAKKELPASVKKPVYGPHSEQKTVDVRKLPSFFAKNAVEQLIKAKHVEKKNETAMFFNCTGYAWARLLSTPFEAPEKKKQ